VLVRARLLRQGGRLAEAEALLRKNRERMDPGTRARASSELGQIYDREGRFDEAMAAWQEAKALLVTEAKPHAYQLQVMRDRLRRLREGLSAERLAEWRGMAGELMPARRVALLGGHPRSGTTLLEQVVDAHAEVISAEETELFHDDAYLVVARGAANEEDMLGILSGAGRERLQAARENYFARAGQFLGEAVGARLLLDKNPSVTFLLAAFVRVFPEARFLIALRDPRDVCLSCYMQSVPLNQASSAWLSLEGTVKEYGELMTMWLTLKPWLAGQALEVRYEEMVEDLPTVARRTLDFLGLTWDERVLGFDAHARQKAVRSPTYADVTRPVFKTAVGRWRNYQKYFEPHLAALEPFVQALGYG
jgi:tetratricopeptide (TPR) repeat protein